MRIPFLFPHSGLSFIAITLIMGTLNLNSQNTNCLQLSFIGEANKGDINSPNTFHELGGFSGLEFDTQKEVFYLLPDKEPARFYTFKLTWDKDALKVVMEKETLLEVPENEFFKGIDPEAIRYNPTKKAIYWTNEKNSNIYESSPTGIFKREFEIPSQFRLHPKKENLGAQGNSSFESLALSKDGKYFYFATEHTLIQDKDCSDHLSKGFEWLRIIEYDIKNETINRAFLYPIIKENGLVEILSYDETTLLMLERSYSPARGNGIFLYQTQIDQVTDIKNPKAICTLDLEEVVFLKSKLLLDFNHLKKNQQLKHLDNIEGMSFGPLDEEGKQTLLFVSDDNFSTKQKTQFLLFAIK